jgi:serine/threonine-protein kinase
MVDDSRVRQLIEEVIDSGRTPEDVCRAYPDLLPGVLRELERLRMFESEVAAMFPAHGPRGPETPAVAPGTGLPEIPGYTVFGVLGSGGMGVVYKARHLKLRRDVAIKMLLTGDWAGPAELARFMREAQAIAALRHPHIIQVYDMGDLEGRPFFTMEYVDGGSLAQKLAGVPQPARDAAAMAATLADAVQFAHTNGIVHRDLKPANILLTADGTLKIGDFGLAASSASGPDLTLGGARLGTPSYMSPEQAIGRRGTVGPLTDIYALGAMLYEMLTGRPPFRSDTSAETERQVIAEEPAPPSRLNAKVPRDLETICLKCLCKDPHRRYAGAAALADDLRRYLRGEPINARRSGPLERLAKWARRHPARSAAWLAGIVSVGAVLGSFLWIASRRAAIERAVSEDLTEAVRLEGSSDWRAARNVVERAKTRLMAGPGSQGGTLAVRTATIERELDLVDRLGAMRLQRGAAGEIEFDRSRWWDSYRGVFAEAGLFHQEDTPSEFAARIARSPIRSALVDAMDDWSICAVREEHLGWLLSATRLADPGSDWRQRARDLSIWKNAAAVPELARSAPVESESVSLLLIVAGRTFESDPDTSIRLLRRIQAAHPSDFWANFALAESLDERRDPNAIGFYRAAVAARPEASAAHHNLGRVLFNQKQYNEAIDSLQRAVSLDGGNAKAHCNLARALGRASRLEEALEHAQVAARLSPEEPVVYGILGLAFKGLGRYGEAAESFRRGMALSPEGSAQRTTFAADLAGCEAAAANPPGPPAPQSP